MGSQLAVLGARADPRTLWRAELGTVQSSWQAEDSPSTQYPEACPPLILQGGTLGAADPSRPHSLQGQERPMGVQGCRRLHRDQIASLPAKSTF